jgi:hypothetical protein
MTGRIVPRALRAAVIALFGIGIASVAPAAAQQAQSSASSPVALASQAGPRVRADMPRAEARFSDAAAPRYADHTTTVRISTIVLVLAIVILVLVLI